MGQAVVGRNMRWNHEEIGPVLPGPEDTATYRRHPFLIGLQVAS
jgi:hypothetical protein